MGKALALESVGNGAQEEIAMEIPYVVGVTIEGASPILFHRWDDENVAERANAKKNSKAKKTDNTEKYLYRDETGAICLPGEYVRQAIIHAAKFRQDPRSPRKSAMDLFKAGVVSMTDLAPLGKDAPDYIDKRRVTIQRNGITRMRPAFFKGWRADLEFQILTPEYIDPQLFHEVMIQAGRLIGVGDFRPTYGRFQVIQFGVVNMEA